MKKILPFGILAIFSATPALAADRMLGSGIVFSAPNTALFRNSAALTDASNLSLQGMWRFEVDNPSVSVVGGSGSVGFGAGYRQEGGAGGDGINIFEAGAAAKLSMMDLGVTLRSVEEDGLNADLAARFNLGKVTLAVVGRNVKGGFDRIDGGLGVELNSQVSFEANLKKPEPFDGDVWLLDFGLVFNANKVALSVGYDMVYTDDDSDGDLHAGLSFQATSNVYLEGYYRPFAQEWSTDDWALGVRAVF